MSKVTEVFTGIRQTEDGIWYSDKDESVEYPCEGHETCMQVEDHSFWFAHRNACVTTLINQFPPPDNGAVFDVGGGNGFVAKAILDAGRDVVLVEPGITGAKNARRRGLKNIVCATLENAKPRRASIPAIGLFDVLEHIKDDTAFLNYLWSLLEPNGCIYLTVPAYNFLWSYDDVHAGHQRRYRLSQITSAVSMAGYHVEFASYFFRPLPPAIFLKRKIPTLMGVRRHRRRDESAMKEHVQKGRLGSLLSILLDSETENIRAQKSMKFGASILLAARKR